MRLRNIPGAQDAILESPYVVQEPQTKKGHWGEVFVKKQPLHIEVGMGKGRFLMDLARLHPDNNCPVRNVLCRLGDKWSMLVLITLNANGTMRFCDIHKTIADISQRMLTVTLRTLETDGLVSRKVYAEVPPRVEYELTERGKSLIPHIEGLVDWALQQMPGIMESRSQTGTA